MVKTLVTNADGTSMTFGAARERPRAPLHTATQRVLAVAGLVALIALVAAETVDALRASDWVQPRPLVDGRMAAAAMAGLAGWVGWAVCASLNAGRAGVRDRPNPLLVPAVAVLQIASWFAVDEFATGDDRRLVWAAWAGAALILHWLATLAYRTSSAVFGEAFGHFTLLAWLPLLAGGVAVASVFQKGVVFGLPMAGAMAVWLVYEGYQAMATWDAECRARITGIDPAAPKPVAVQYAEAVAQVTRPPNEPARTNFHHTMLPRAMVLASLVLGLALPAMIIVLEREGHVSVKGINTTLDDHAAGVMTGLVVAALVTYALGWLWWSVAAALNATSHSRWSVDAWSAPAGYGVSVAALVVVPLVSERVDPDLATVVVLIGVFVLAIAHFAVLRAYRHTADSIGGAVAPWTRVIVLPWAALGFSILVAFLSKTIGDVLFERIMEAGWVLFYAAYAISLYSAMASFDRACRGRIAGGDGKRALPEFLKRRAHSADNGA